MTEEMTRRFLTRLWELQADAGLTNAELARRLGCSASYIHHIKTGRPGRGKSLGLNLVLAAVSLFPELNSFLVADLRTGNDNVPPRNECGEDA
jgi:transcriptional regulator with XRE-family HTH domain